MRGLAKLPSDTVIDGELIALGDDGRPSFNALQNYGSASTPILYFVFDVMVFEGRDVKTETLDSRRKLLEQRIVPKLTEPVRYSSSSWNGRATIAFGTPDSSACGRTRMPATSGGNRTAFC